MPSTEKKESGTQCGYGGSYGQKKDSSDVMADKKVLIKWLMAEGLLGKSQLCPHCNTEMKLVTCKDR